MTPLLRSDGKALYVLRVKSTRAVINPRAISNTIGEPNVDPTADLEYLPIFTEDRPDNDSTFTTATTEEAPNEANVPPRWEIKYRVVDRPADEVKSAAANVKRFEADKQLPQADFKETVILMLAAILRDSKGLELTPDEDARKTSLIEMALRLQANRDNLTDIQAAIDLGAKPDLSAGWAAAPRR